LAGHAARLRPLLQEPGFVDDEHTGHLVPELVENVPPEIVAHLVGVPRGGAEQALHPARPGFAHRLRQLPPVRAVHPVEQPRPGAPGAFARFQTRKAATDPRVQLRQRIRAPRDRDRPVPVSRGLHGAPRAQHGKRPAITN
jgi:hypothetical protein